MDVTGNPLVGLYFACKKYNEDNKKTTEAQGGNVFQFAVKQENLLYYDSNMVRMLSCLAGLIHEEKSQIKVVCDRKMVEAIRKCYCGSSIKRYELFDASNNGREVERLYQTIRIEVPSFKKEMSAFDLQANLFVQPLKNNPRILKKDGAFLIFGLSMKPEEANELARNHVRQELYISNQDKILKELDAVGINEATLFPEVDKVAGYLKNL